MDNLAEFELFCIVRVRNDMPEEGLAAGDTGTIIEVFEHPHRAYEVGFVDDQGQTTAQCALRPDEIELIWSPPTAALTDDTL